MNPHHPQARLTVAGRQLAVARVRAGVPVVEVATALGVSRQTMYKWLRRAADASPEWTDRSSRPPSWCGCYKKMARLSVSS